MLSADFASIAANTTLFLLLVRFIQTHMPKDSTLASALAYIFH